MNKIKVLKIGVNEGDIEAIMIEPKLESYQKLVGGYIEVVSIPELPSSIKLIANEEGLLTGLPTNANLIPYFFVGDLIAVSVEGEDFDGLSNNDLGFLAEWIYSLEKLRANDRRIARLHIWEDVK